MASTQQTNPFLKLEHKTNEAIMQRDFTKRQRKILDLIIRLSLGCRKKTAVIPLQRDFEVVGVGESHIKKELDWLCESQVIFIDGANYSFNENYDQWQVSRVKPFMPEALAELVRINLKGTYQKSKSRKRQFTKTVSHNLPKQKETTYQNSKNATHKLAMPKEKVKKSIKENSEYMDIWEKVKSELEKQMNPSNYATWIQPTTGLDVINHTLIVSVPSEYVIEYLNKTQRSLIEKTIQQVTGKSYSVQFTVVGKDNEMSSQPRDEGDADKR